MQFKTSILTFAFWCLDSRRRVFLINSVRSPTI